MAILSAPWVFNQLLVAGQIHDHSREQIDDAVKHLFAGDDAVDVETFLSDKDVEAARAFQGQPPRNLEESTAVFKRPLPVPFRNIVRDAGRRIVEMPLGRRRLPRTFVENRLTPCHKLNRDSIYFQLFVVEIDSHRRVAPGC